MCFLAGFLHHHVGSCMRDDSRPWFSMVNESDQSNEGVVVVANELRSIGAIGSTQQEFENAFNEQVNEVYSQQFENENFTELFDGIENTSDSLLDTSGGIGGDPTFTQDFCPSKWLPMLSEQGSKVGNGNFGNVYTVQVKCSEQQPLVAVKKDIKKNPRAQLEIDAGMAFNHAHLVKFYDNDKIGDKAVILMEAVTGGSLEKKYKDCTDKDLSKYVLQILSGLKHIHDKNYVHADIKPEQMMLLCRSNNICDAKLGDFGFTEGEGIKSSRGTPYYMSPELFVTEVITKQNDMWAFGVSLFEMTYGGKFPSYLAKATNLYTLGQILTNIYQNEQKSTKHWANTKSLPIQQLISGLLRVDAKKRLTVEGAIDAAKPWAKKYYEDPEIEAFLKNDVSKRVALPDCWEKCKNQCDGRRCTAKPQPQCSNPKSSNVNTITVNDRSIGAYETVEFTLYFNILDHITLDLDARLLVLQNRAIELGFRALDVIIEVAGLPIVRDSNEHPVTQVIKKLVETKTYPIKVKVLRPVRRQALPQVTPKPNLVWETVWDPYMNYPNGGYRKRLIMT